MDSFRPFFRKISYSASFAIQLLHIRYIGLNEYRYNSATEKGAGHQYASFDRSIDGGNTSAPLVFLRLLQEFPEFLGTHDNLLIIVKLHHTFCLLDSKMIAPVRADFITISRFIGIDHSMSVAEQNRAQSRRESRPESGRRRRRPVAEVALAEAHVHLLAVVLDVGAALLAVGGRARQAVPLGGQTVVGVLVPGYRSRVRICIIVIAYRLREFHWSRWDVGFHATCYATTIKGLETLGC